MAGVCGTLGQHDKAADRAALVDVLMKMQRLAVDLSGEIAEVDVNPLLAGPDGAIAADAVVVLVWCSWS